MSVFLNEAVGMELTESHLDLLDEYLILAEGVTVDEAKHFIKIAILEERSDVSTLNARKAERVKSLNKKYAALEKVVKADKKLTAAAKTRKLNVLARAFNKEMDVINKWVDRASKLVSKNKKGIINKVKLGAMKMKPRTKIGAGLAVGAAGIAGIGGYAAYRAKKKAAAQA